MGWTGWHSMDRLFTTFTGLSFWLKRGHLGGCPGCKVLRGKVLTRFWTGWTGFCTVTPQKIRF